MYNSIFTGWKAISSHFWCAWNRAEIKKKIICGVSSRFYGLYPKDLTILKAFWGLQKELSVTDFFIQVPVIFTLAHP